MAETTIPITVIVNKKHNNNSNLYFLNFRNFDRTNDFVAKLALLLFSGLYVTKFSPIMYPLKPAPSKSLTYLVSSPRLLPV